MLGLLGAAPFGRSVEDRDHPENLELAMNVTVEIPDELASQMTAAGDNLSRRILETIALEEYKAERISKAQLRRALGFETRFELDDLLKAHHAGPNFTIEDLRRDLKDLQSLGLLTSATGRRRHGSPQLSHLGRAH
jgi:hypothetical protein